MCFTQILKYDSVSLKILTLIVFHLNIQIIEHCIQIFKFDCVPFDFSNMIAFHSIIQI